MCGEKYEGKLWVVAHRDHPNPRKKVFLKIGDCTSHVCARTEHPVRHDDTTPHRCSCTAVWWGNLIGWKPQWATT